MRLQTLISFTFLVLSLSVTGQQEWQYSLNAFNLYDINSAYAGSFKEISIGARYRYQWTGIDGAPQSQLVSVHMPIFQNLGAGLRLYNESIGARRRQSFKASVAYKLPLRTGYLGFAFNGGMIGQRYQRDELTSKNDLSNILYEDNERASTVVVDFSSLWYSNNHFLGFEIQNINEPSFFPGVFVDMKQVRHYNFIGGYAYKIHEDLVLRPTGALRLISGTSPSTEINISAFVNKKIWFGAGYRINYGILAFTEWNISNQFRIGYSYDASVGELRSVSNSAHEIFLGYRIKTNEKEGNSIRYFK